MEICIDEINAFAEINGVDFCFGCKRLFNVNYRIIFHNFGIFNSRDTIELDVLNTACLLKTVNINFNYLLYNSCTTRIRNK